MKVWRKATRPVHEVPGIALAQNPVKSVKVMGGAGRPDAVVKMLCAGAW